MFAIFSDKGRIGWAQFIATVLGSALVLLVIFIVCVLGVAVFVGPHPNEALLRTIGGTEAVIWAYILLMSLTKRMRDAGVHPLWALAVFLGPLVIILPVIFAVYPGTNDGDRDGPQPEATR